jgi:hypothetical protein
MVGCDVGIPDPFELPIKSIAVMFSYQFYLATIFIISQLFSTVLADVIYIFVIEREYIIRGKKTQDTHSNSFPPFLCIEYY